MKKFSLCNYEFFTSPDNRVYMVKQGEANREFTWANPDDIQFTVAFIDYLTNCYPEALSSLSRLFEGSRVNTLVHNYKIVSRFIRCNFGAYDTRDKDIDVFGNFHFEEVPCPLRGSGECKMEGVCCKPVFNTRLTEREKEVYRLIVERHDTAQIAAVLFVSPHTVNNHRKNIEAKVGAHSEADLISFWYQKNLH